MITQHLTASAHGIETAADLLRAGQTVAFPTETVYGLGGDATQGAAVAAIYAAKDRPQFNPLIAHVPDREAARRLVIWSDTAERLASAFWPGPLTLVLPRRPDAPIASLVTAGLPSLALRVPDHSVAQALLRAVDRPLAAPSANPSGRISSVTADHVIAGLDGRIGAVLDAGPTTVGLESTIIGLLPQPVLLRPGGLAIEEIEACLGVVVHSHQQSDNQAPVAPGQLTSHYAPRAPLRLNAVTPRPGEILIGFGDVVGDVSLSSTGDLLQAASRLFSVLHDADAQGQPIAVAPVPPTGLGAAINDRLARAAAPRPQDPSDR